MSRTTFARKAGGKGLVILGHVIAASLAVAVPVATVAFEEDVFRIIAAAFVAMLVATLAVFAGDRLLGFDRPSSEGRYNAGAPRSYTGLPLRRTRAARRTGAAPPATQRSRTSARTG